MCTFRRVQLGDCLAMAKQPIYTSFSATLSSCITHNNFRQHVLPSHRHDFPAQAIRWKIRRNHRNSDWMLMRQHSFAAAEIYTERKFSLD